MKIGLLVDRLRINRWQAEAIRKLGEGIEIVVYNCTNSPTPPRPLRHIPYFLLNITSLRNDLTRHAPLPDRARLAGRLDFESELDGAWQKLPPPLIDRINADRSDAIVKFGMGLLRVPGNLKAPILSYHHGDPRQFRGRPAGFYELLEGKRVLGQIVQILSNRLDAGPVVAYAETRVLSHSYRATMRAAYAASPLLLPKALALVAEERTLDLAPEGQIYRLPSPAVVFRFAVQRLAAGLRRLAYGGFFEKGWQVARAPAQFDNPLGFATFPAKSHWRRVDCPPEFRFLADPFPHPSAEGILVEAMRSATGLGEILHVANGKYNSLVAGGGHYSYPATFSTKSGHFLLPETCQWSRPKLLRIGRDGGVRAAGALAMRVPVRLVDPTLFERDGTIYLFGNDYSEGDFVLRLWRADRLDGCFEEHPASPLLISPRGARMAGALIELQGLFRVGQDGSRDYGDGLLLFRIDELSPAAFRETLVDELHFSGVRGPHTFNLDGGDVLFDYYEHRFAPLAGLRRIRNRLASSARSSRLLEVAAAEQLGDLHRVQRRALAQIVADHPQ